MSHLWNDYQFGVWYTPGCLNASVLINQMIFLPMDDQCGNHHILKQFSPVGQPGLSFYMRFTQCTLYLLPFIKLPGIIDGKFIIKGRGSV